MEKSPYLKSCDIVYIVKDTEYNGELRHSLRSVCQNFPHRNIWFIGGKPKRIYPDYYQPVPQSNTKFNNADKLFNAIAENKYISNNFILFNDDFFVLKPIKKLPVYIDGTLAELIERVKVKNGIMYSDYTKLLKKTIEDLTKLNLPCNSFALHIPMMINKKKMRDVIGVFGRFNRSLYGNYVYKENECVKINDVKIISNIQIPKPDQTFVSTRDGSFNIGEVGKYIRKKFNQPCEYEAYEQYKNNSL